MQRREGIWQQVHFLFLVDGQGVHQRWQVGASSGRGFLGWLGAALGSQVASKLLVYRLLFGYQKWDAMLGGWFSMCGELKPVVRHIYKPMYCTQGFSPQNERVHIIHV